ncbi:DUF2683 family protein [archaeon]|jgi:hypothetical protein|nr:DUF2683 family protein [archaeon]MBT4351459.1 DUF2683 family protein [archaeon]MBT4647739.1 DUF2683 family protein [archaeon]MBT6821267.1 DUF2683 family protein [archaeon]MBT7392056.1 DUF2683 family protein [archaeon]
MISARVKLNDYTNKVLNMIKIKYDLDDKSQALNKFADLYGEEIVEKQPKDEYVKKILKICDDDMKKYGNKTMTLKELDELFEV